uniref:Cleavage and polyadenylation specificity factor subunit 4 n=1 Tax=Rhabditophanes sp. KR3021 TaxID=114890 RepID=A0AC35UI80_9BILA
MSVLVEVPITDFDIQGFEEEVQRYPWLTDIERNLSSQIGLAPVLFQDMDKGGRGACEKFTRNECVLSTNCPLRHINMNKSVVCKHWLRGLCKKGDQCEFLHEYNLSKMPECFFFSKYKACSNKECSFRHIDPESKIKDCPWYDRGFCRHGPYCKHRHRRRVFCPNYLIGFCPNGKDCKDAHPSFAIPVTDSKPKHNQQNFIQNGIVCHNCHEKGHKATFCPSLPNSQGPQPISNNPPPFRVPNNDPQAQPILATGLVNFGRTYQSHTHHFEKKNLSEITCYKCNEKGHYANRCNKGSLAFLSTSRGNAN